jgi:aspartate/tyrosine/aromatic aminotransferase
VPRGLPLASKAWLYVTPPTGHDPSHHCAHNAASPSGHPTHNHTRQEYQPIGGNAQFCALSAALAYGPDFDGLRDGRVAVVQTLSGTGALAVGGAFLARHYAASKQVFVPNPTWGNHHGVFLV